MAANGARIRGGGGVGGSMNGRAVQGITVVGRAVPDASDGDDDMESGSLIKCDEDGKDRAMEKLGGTSAAATSSTAPASPAAVDEPRLFGMPLKWLSLASLTLQTSAQALLIRWSKAASEDGEPRYISSSAVFMTEVVKVFASLCLVVYESGGLAPAGAALKDNFTKSKVELLKACVPSLIYTIQNNLMFYSLELLSAPVQQVLYQMKVVTTAGIGVIMLSKSLTTTQWAACFMLTVGVGLVQWPRGEVDFDGVNGDHLKGFLAVFTACCTSGFAGVWIQKMLQQSSQSIWMRNVQLAGFGSMMSITVAVIQDGEVIANEGLFRGYNIRVVSVILMTAFGGLLCAVMLKYAGATHGCFSTAMSIILTSMLSQALLGDFAPDFLFVCGTAVAVSASLLFALGPPQCLRKYVEN